MKYNTKEMKKQLENILENHPTEKDFDAIQTIKRYEEMSGKKLVSQKDIERSLKLSSEYYSEVVGNQRYVMDKKMEELFLKAQERLRKGEYDEVLEENGYSPEDKSLIFPDL